MRGVPRARRAISCAPSSTDADAEHARAARDDPLQLLDVVEVEPDGMPKRSRSGVVSRPARVVAPTSVNFGRSILHRARRRPLADDEVELEILHRRIEDFLDRRGQAMDLVDEEHVALFEVGQQRREIAGLGDHRARRWCGS